MFSLLLFFVAAMSVQTVQAQSNGDVNGDGVVDEKDITAILKIMAEAGGVKKKAKYYWYVGQEAVTADNYTTLAEQLELDYTNACEEVKNELFQQLSDVDIALEEHAKKMAAKNILTFSCVCSRDLIPCAIDFTKENIFVCPRCQSKYKVAINANPVLIGKNISDEEFAELVEKRLNENKKTN